jgi:hypothetical protein
METAFKNSFTYFTLKSRSYHGYFTAWVNNNHIRTDLQGCWTMKDTIESKSNQYQSYLLRMWKNGDGDWRALLVSIPTQERRHFSNLQELFEFLNNQQIPAGGLDISISPQTGMSSRFSIPSVP